ncbi:ABC transporter substrate-binding protein [Halovulum sp. GXIMD14794]
MNAAPLSVAFIPLVDAAPLIVAHEMGFAREEGLELNLLRAPSWSSVRDMLAFGRAEAAHMLSPVPVAMALGIGGVASSISALMVTSLNGTVVGVSARLEAELRAAGHGFGFSDAAVAGAALVAAAHGRPLRIGVPFPFSMHAELLYYWLSASGLPAPQTVEIRTVPPPLMADAIAAEEIDAFCVGEPWGSKAVEMGAGALLLPGRAIWSAAPEKVLAVRADWAAAEPELTGRLMRAVWRACRWLGEGGAQTTAAEMLARPGYLNLSSEIIDRALTGRLTVSARGEVRDCKGFVEFHAGAATYPWRSQAAWIATRMAARLGLDRAAAVEQARAVFRTDLYRQHLRDVGAVLPGASDKLEGGILPGTAAPSETGRLILTENRFFDGQIFDLSGAI